MSNWFGVRDQIFGFADQMFDLTRDSMGNTSFDVFGNETHRSRMQNDELYRDAFNELNKPKPGMSSADFAQNQLNYYRGLWEGRQRQVWDSYGQADALTANDIFNHNFMESTPEPRVQESINLFTGPTPMENDGPIGSPFDDWGF